MKSFLLSICLVFPLCVYAQYNARCFKMSNNASNTEQYVGLTTSQDTTIQLNYPFGIDEFYITGFASLNNWDSGYIRVTLTDSYNMEYLVYELYPLLADSLNNSCHKISIETCLLDNIVPQNINISISNASFSLDSIYYVKTPHSKRNNRESSVSIQKSQNSYIINKLNSHLEERDIPWRAGLTSMSSLTFDEKKALFGGNVPNLGGFEHYIGGIFVAPNYGTSVNRDSVLSSPYVDEWDWRNRHGKNWNTPIKNQSSCASCWAFAATATLEAYINLYYNQLINYDLSEQELVSCSTINGCGGGSSVNALNYIYHYGIVEEACFPYTASNNDCSNKCSNPDELISFSNAYTICYNIPDDSIKKQVITKPICISVDSWHHALELVGYKTLEPGDRIYYLHDQWITLSDTSQFIGQTAWLAKNSWGSNWGDQGYVYLLLNSGDILRTVNIEGSVHSSIYTDDDIVCSDEDGDGYYFWGIGPKPAHCPAWVPNTPDGDDSDYTKGPMDNYGYLANISDLLNDTLFINQDTIWTQPRFVYSHVVVQNGATLQINSLVTFYKDVTMLLRGSGNLCLNGGVLYNADVKIIENSPSNITIINNGNINMREVTNFYIPLGGEFQFDYGTIK